MMNANIASRGSRSRLLRQRWRQVGRNLKVGTIYGLLGIVLAYAAIATIAIAIVGLIATPILAFCSIVLNAFGDSLSSKL